MFVWAKTFQKKSPKNPHQTHSLRNFKFYLKIIWELQCIPRNLSDMHTRMCAHTHTEQSHANLVLQFSNSFISSNFILHLTVDFSSNNLISLCPVKQNVKQNYDHIPVSLASLLQARQLSITIICPVHHLHRLNWGFWARMVYLKHVI